MTPKEQQIIGQALRDALVEALGEEGYRNVQLAQKAGLFAGLGALESLEIPGKLCAMPVEGTAFQADDKNGIVGFLLRQAKQYLKENGSFPDTAAPLRRP